MIVFIDDLADIIEAAELAKRPRLEKEISNDSSGTGGTASSVTSQFSLENQNDRTGAVSTGPVQRGTIGVPYSQPAMPGSQTSRVSQNSQIRPLSQGSSGSISNPILPGYRDIVIGSSQQQTLAWREHVRGQEPSRLPPITNVSDQRSNQGGVPGSPLDSPSHPSLPVAQSFHSMAPGYTPPLLTSESTVSTNSNTSGASAFYPRTPLETPFDRSLPVPSFFSAKLPQSSPFDTSLPPLGPSSLSPQPFQRTPYSGQPGKRSSEPRRHLSPL